MQRKRTAAEAFAHYAERHPTYDHGESWLSHCAALIFRMTKSTRSYGFSWQAADAARPLDTHHTRAGVGALHYFGPKNGASHVAIQIDVHGNLAMSSNFLAKRVGSHGLGTNTVAGYLKDSPAHTYLGWAHTYGTNGRWAVSDFGHTRETVKQAAKTKGSGALQTAALGVKPARPERASAMVKRVSKYLNARGTGFISTAATTGIRGPLYWHAIQTAGRQDGLYGPGFLINGIPGPRSRSLEKHYAALTLKLFKH